MPESVKSYRLYLVVYDEFLLEMAGVIGAEYVPSSFDRAVEEMYEADEWSADWEMRGKLGRFGVFIERGDSYFSCSLRAQEPHFRAGRELMWERYIAQGGNPDAAKRP